MTSTTTAAAAAATKPLVARSNDGSLIAIHHNDSTTTTNGLVRCYDGNVSNGALKFTLRFPLLRSSTSNTSDNNNNNLSSLSTSAAESKDELRKLVFASSDDSGNDGDNNSTSNPPSYLCGMCQSSSIHIWDLERGVLSQTLDTRTTTSASSSSSKKKKKHRKSSMSSTTTEGKEILCDIITTPGNNPYLYALMFFPSEGEQDDNNNNSGNGGKCRVYQYKLDASGATLVKKIKVGSIHAAPPMSSSVTLSNGSTKSSATSFAIAISKTTMIIRMGTVLRIYDATTGDKLCKIDLPADVILSSTNRGGDDDYDNNNNNRASHTSTLVAPLACTSDGRYIVTGIHNHAVVFHYEQKNESNDHHTLQTSALLSTKDDSPITHLDLTLSHDRLGVLAFQPRAEIASLFVVADSSSSLSSLVPQLPKAHLQTNEKDTTVSFLGAGFHHLLRINNATLQLLFQRIKKSGGSAAGSGTILPMESVSDALDSLEGTVIVGTSLTIDGAKTANDGKKRKVAESVALAPGDQGREALLAMDLSQGGGEKKKPRVSSSSTTDGADGADEEVVGEAEDDFPDDLDEDGEQRQSIAERLALLSSAMEETDDEEDEDDDDEEKADSTHKSKFKLNSATSETLTSLLTQALSSNDPTQLNIALQVTDRRLVEGTVRSLQNLDAERARQMMKTDSGAAAVQQTRYIPTLMAHIVRRMARRHSLVMPLGVWIKAILAATARSSTNQAVFGHDGGGGGGGDQIMAKEGREMARALGPLKNFLNERVECFAQMLRLDGRLALLNQQL
ncbi:hypothetical protein ACHAWU_000252 [Discostella pseudostelligera]|uniref:Small-subunit processome Utp12 domain-containing protein n=1 Tax=Discostella pseudostelligera TaxID=259834 RepID=A0ABD3MC38_9STRA